MYSVTHYSSSTKYTNYIYIFVNVYTTDTMQKKRIVCFLYKLIYCVAVYVYNIRIYQTKEYIYKLIF